MSGNDLALPEPSRPPQTNLKEYALLLPRLLKLVFNLARDPRVPPRSKAVLVVLAAYLASPVDLIPDFLPGIGQLDDLAVIAFALDQMVNRVDAKIVREHWDGDGDSPALVLDALHA